MALIIGPAAPGSGDCTGCCEPGEAVAQAAHSCCDPQGGDGTTPDHGHHHGDDAPTQSDCSRHLACHCAAGVASVLTSANHPAIVPAQGGLVAWPVESATMPGCLHRLKRPPRAVTSS